VTLGVWLLIILFIAVVIILIVGLGRGKEEGFLAGRQQVYEGQPVELRGRVFRCPKCGNTVDPLSPRCPYCGAEFEIGSYACPDCGGLVTLHDIYCPHCGSLLLAEPYACPRCLRIVPPESTKCPWCGVEYWSPIRLDEETFRKVEKRVSRGRMMVERSSTAST